nr:hypothetical protein GCM10020063_092400 [Dactylosporangium thailandense]
MLAFNGAGWTAPTRLATVGDPVQISCGAPSFCAVIDYQGRTTRSHPLGAGPGPRRRGRTDARRGRGAGSALAARHRPVAARHPIHFEYRAHRNPMRAPHGVAKESRATYTYWSLSLSVFVNGDPCEGASECAVHFRLMGEITCARQLRLGSRIPTQIE